MLLGTQRSSIEIWICPACGAHYPPSAQPPARCPLCEDERQWVPPTGQEWKTMAELARAGYRTEIRELEPGLLGIGVAPSDIGVGQRGLLVSTAAGNLLWDPPVFIDQAAIDAVRQAGGLAAVTSSHPHMYGAIVEWSHAFDAEIVIPEADRYWLMRPDPAVRTWSVTHEVMSGLTLIQCGGHFPGSAVLHWAAGGEGRGALFVGDTIFITPGADRVSFIWSAPNRLPLPERAVRGLLDALTPYEFESLYGGWWGPVIRDDGRRIVERSADRYIELLRGEVSPAPRR